MQDELARVSDRLEVLCEERRQEAAKQVQNARYLSILDEDVHRLTAREEKLMEEHAKWLEAHPPGEQACQSACSTVVGQRECSGLSYECGRLGACAPRTSVLCDCKTQDGQAPCRGQATVACTGHTLKCSSQLDTTLHCWPLLSMSALLGCHLA